MSGPEMGLFKMTQRQPDRPNSSNVRSSGDRLQDRTPRHDWAARGYAMRRTRLVSVVSDRATSTYTLLIFSFRKTRINHRTTAFERAKLPDGTISPVVGSSSVGSLIVLSTDSRSAPTARA